MYIYLCIKAPANSLWMRQQLLFLMKELVCHQYQTIYRSIETSVNVLFQIVGLHFKILKWLHRLYVNLHYLNEHCYRYKWGNVFHSHGLLQIILRKQLIDGRSYYFLYVLKINIFSFSIASKLHMFLRDTIVYSNTIVGLIMLVKRLFISLKKQTKTMCF